MRCQDPDKPSEEYLLTRIQIECEACGGVIDYHIIGHHIPAVIKALQKAQEMYPDLCKQITTEVPAGVNLLVPPGGGKVM